MQDPGRKPGVFVWRDGIEKLSTLVIAYVVARALFASWRMILLKIRSSGPLRLVSRGGVAAVSASGGGDSDGDREAVTAEKAPSSDKRQRT